MAGHGYINPIFLWIATTFELYELTLVLIFVSALGWFEISNQYDDRVEALVNKRRARFKDELQQQPTDAHLFDLFERGWDLVNEPTAILGNAVSYFRGAFLLFLMSLLNEYAVDNITAIQVPPLQSLTFLVGLILMLMGLVSMDNIRRMVKERPLVDPPPVAQSVVLAVILAVNSLFLWDVLKVYPNYNSFGWTFLASLFIAYVGGFIVISRWDSTRKVRLVGTLLMLAPWFVYATVLTLILLHLPYY